MQLSKMHTAGSLVLSGLAKLTNLKSSILSNLGTCAQFCQDFPRSLKKFSEYFYIIVFK